MGTTFNRWIGPDRNPNKNVVGEPPDFINIDYNCQLQYREYCIDTIQRPRRQGHGPRNTSSSTAPPNGATAATAAAVAPGVRGCGVMIGTEAAKNQLATINRLMVNVNGIG